jgi:hypothetical protein
MSVGVQFKRQKQQNDDLGKILTIAGAVGGGIATGGSPAGISAGAGMGGMAGGLMAEPVQAGPDPIQTGGSDALQRRMQKLQDSPQMQIASSIDSLKYVQDDQLRADLAKPLMQADYLARNKGSV